LRRALGEAAVVRNPVDMAPTAGPSDFEGTVKLVLADDTVDAVLAIFSAPLSPHVEEIVGAILSGAASETGKPLLASVLGRHLVMGTADCSVPSFAFPESAVRALARVTRYSEWRRRPQGHIAEFVDTDVGAARQVVDTALGRMADPGVWLDPASARHLLDAYRIPFATDETGVETVVEVVQDPLFGPLVAFGTGGVVGELLGDRAFRALPLTDVDAAELVRSGRGARLLEGAAGAAPADLSAVEDLVLRVGRLVEDIPEVTEMALDPVIAGPERATAAGVRVRLTRWQPQPERALRRLR
jgi:acyl-CoA synthetase (NDP forming)